MSSNGFAVNRTAYKKSTDIIGGKYLTIAVDGLWGNNLDLKI